MDTPPLSLLRIEPADFADPAVLGLIQLHVQGMRAGSPPGHSFALDSSGLNRPEVALFVARVHHRVAGMGALKALTDRTGEIKSMRTHPEFLRRGIGAAILEHLIAEATRRGYQRVSLETGTGPTFDAALALYRARGFTNGPAFGDYEASAFNQFLHLDLV